MKLIIDMTEARKIIAKHFEEKGLDVKSSLFSIEYTGKVDNIRFELEITDK